MKRPLPWDWIALALVGITVFAMHFLLFDRATVADDVYFSNALRDRTLLEFLAMRYQRWSARVPLEAMLVLLINHVTAWRILNSLMVLLLCHGVGRLALGANATAPAATSIAFGVLMLMPARVMSVAWWVTGSFVYLWPAAFGLYGSIRLAERSRRRPIENGLMVLATGLAVYNELVAITLLPVCLVLVFDRIRSGHRDRWDAVHVACLLANVCVVFGAPGSYARFRSEQVTWFPHYATLGLLERVDLGVGLAVRTVFDRDNLMVLVLAGGCIRLLLRRALTPVTLVLLAGPATVVAWALLLRVDHDAARLVVDAVLAGLPADAVASPLRHLGQAIAVGAIVLLSAAVGAVLAADGASALRLSGLMASAFLSIVAIGFSPTVHASGHRTSFVAMVILALITCRVLYASAGPGALRAVQGSRARAPA